MRENTVYLELELDVAFTFEKGERRVRYNSSNGDGTPGSADEVIIHHVWVGGVNGCPRIDIAQCLTEIDMAQLTEWCMEDVLSEEP